MCSLRLYLVTSLQGSIIQGGEAIKCFKGKHSSAAEACDTVNDKVDEVICSLEKVKILSQNWWGGAFFFAFLDEFPLEGKYNDWFIEGRGW